ncbi:MAG TPA: hypothetical protein PKA63_13615 [Oligoflexia bacterium]|nr:hypothetical protein [Oligoflexia bacterium]HMP49700.1 hypothetical protein [Oligoflexia bacterium]
MGDYWSLGPDQYETASLGGSKMGSLNAPLEKAARLVSELWFPYDLNIFESVRKKAKADTAGVMVASLVEEIKKDISLYLLCLKEFSKPEEIQYRETHLVSDCPDYFSGVSSGMILDALNRISKMAIPYRLDQASSFQKQRLAEMYVSGFSVDAIGGSSGFSSGVVFSCSMLRQLGLTLVAWNYPLIFDKVSCTGHSADSLDAELRKYLGFSPAMLGAALVEKWGLSGVYRNVVSSRAGNFSRVGKSDSGIGDVDNESEKNTGNLSRVLAQICQVGEALARATNPSLYSSARSDLDFANEFITETLGSNGVENILRGADERIKLLGSSLADSVAEGISTIKDGLLQKTYSFDLISKNRYVEVFPEGLRSSAEALYYNIRPDGPVDSYARDFAKQIIPKTVFSALTVYLYDPFEELLFPSLVLGSHRFIAPRPEKLKTQKGVPNPVTAALDLRIPLREEHLLSDGKEICILVSSLGVDPSIGVLYVEAPVDGKVAEGNEFNGDMIKYFKGVRNLLSQCLRIEFSEN